jgi:hypothetical protein
MSHRASTTWVLLAAIFAVTTGCKAKQPAPPAIDAHKLVIENAVWGALYEGLTTDVTGTIRGMVEKDAVRVVATTLALGDPAPGKIKYLRVMYTKGGVLSKKIVGEGGTLAVAHDETATPLRLVVTKAVYGDFVGGKTLDLTLRLADLVKDDHLSISNYIGSFGDPAPGKSKQLRVEYTVDGQARSKVVSEIEPLELAAPKQP